MSHRIFDDMVEPSAVVSPDRTLSRRTLLLVGLVLCAHAVLAWHLRIWGVTSGDDDAGYVLLARALRDGHFRELHDAALLVGAKYPPGYPALIAVISLIAGESVTAILVTGIAASVLALVLVFDTVRQRWGTTLALIVLTLSAINPAVVQNAGRLMSEAPFMAFLVIALWAAARKPQTAGMAVLAGAAAIAAGLTRSAGITLMPAIGLFWLLQRRYLWVATFTVVSSATVGAWTAWTIFAPDAKARDLYASEAIAFVGTASSPLMAFANRTMKNIIQYSTQFLPNTLPVPSVGGTRVDNVLAVVILAVLLAVGLVAVWRRWRVAMLFLVLYAMLLVLWAFPIERFIEPIAPLFLLAVLLGTAIIGRRFGQRAGVIAVAVVAIAIGGRAVATDAALLAAADRCDRTNPTASAGCVTPDEMAFFNAAAYIKQTTDTGALVITAKPRPFYYYSGRRTIVQNVVLNGPLPQIPERVAESGADYVLVTGLGYWATEFRDDMTKACESFTVVREFPPRTVLLRQRKDGDPPACAVLERTNRPN